MKLLTPYGMSDYIPGGIVSANRGHWEKIEPRHANPIPTCTDEYDFVSATDSSTGIKTWWYRTEILQ